MTISLILVLTLATLVGCAVLAAAEPKPTPAGGSDPSVMESMRPGPEHRRLARRAGSWDVSCSMRMGPDAPVVESRGTSTFRAILDGRFIQADFTGSFQGQPFTGLSLMGYDRVTKQYISTWCDSLATTLVHLEGTSTDDGRTITYTGETVCPQLGPMTLRQVEVHERDDRFTLVMYQKLAGKPEFTSMELVYERRR